MRFLLVDHVAEIQPGRYVRGTKKISPTDPLLSPAAAHQAACFPFSFVGETLGQLCLWNVMVTHDFHLRAVAGIVDAVRVHRPVFAGDTLALEAWIDHLDAASVVYHAAAHVGNVCVLDFEGAVGPLLPMTDFIARETVQAQWQQLLTPGATCHTDRLPQDAPPLHLHFDRILSCTPGQSLVAEKFISPDAPYFPDHFPNRPVLPLTVLLECIQTLAPTLLKTLSPTPQRYRLTQLSKIKMKEFIPPGATLTTTLSCQAHSPEHVLLKSQTAYNGKRFCTLELHFTQEPL